jgi:hypothetical protein
VNPGQLVQYDDGGLHVGYVANYDEKTQTVTIRVIPPYKAEDKKAKTIKRKLSEIEEVF